MKVLCALLFLCLATTTFAISYSDVRGKPYKVSYDHRAILINGERVLLQSAGMHYPRSSPSMWPQLMQDSAAAGLNTMQTYVFHNYHEEVKGHWDWTTEHRNLSGFIQAAADAGMFVNLRIGPYVCAESVEPPHLHSQLSLSTPRHSSHLLSLSYSLFSGGSMEVSPCGCMTPASTSVTTTPGGRRTWRI